MITLSDVISSNYPVITMGTFDGVHKGHQSLFAKVIERAVANDGVSIAITYYHHPKEILNKGVLPYLLTEKERKEAIIKELGIDYVAFLEFDHQMSLMRAEDFLRDVIQKKFRAKEIVFGYDCHFGYLREGNYQFLTEKQDTYGYTPLIVEPEKIDGIIVSSSLIRSMIKEGKVEEASRFLGRNYDLQGTVIPGRGIGKKLGFPTVNINPSDEFKLIPAKGVYLAKAQFDNSSYFCLTNIGNSPTLKNDAIKLVECYLLNFSGELYGKEIRIEFICRIRDEMKFDSKEELIAAIQKDKDLALTQLIGKYM